MGTGELLLAKKEREQSSGEEISEGKLLEKSVLIQMPFFHL